MGENGPLSCICFVKVFLKCVILSLFIVLKRPIVVLELKELLPVILICVSFPSCLTGVQPDQMTPAFHISSLGFTVFLP